MCVCNAVIFAWVLLASLKETSLTAMAVIQVMNWIKSEEHGTTDTKNPEIFFECSQIQGVFNFRMYMVKYKL